MLLHKILGVLSVVALGLPSASAVSWQRSVDWIVEPAGYAGTSTGNPAPDSQGNQGVWGYEWVEGGGGLGSANPWYTLPTQKSVWDNNWYSTGSPGWVQADDEGNHVVSDYTPFIGDTQMGLRLSAPSAPQAPLVRWINPTIQPLQVALAGGFTVGWQGGTTGYPVAVDLVIARETDLGQFDLVFSTSVSKPHNDLSKEFLYVPVAATTLVSPGDSLVFSLWQNGQGNDNWITLDDIITITAVPEPASLAMLAGAGAGLLLRRRTAAGHRRRWPFPGDR